MTGTKTRFAGKASKTPFIAPSIFFETAQAFYRERARTSGISTSVQTGAVNVAHRTSADLRRNPRSQARLFRRHGHDRHGPLSLLCTGSP